MSTHARSTQAAPQLLGRSLQDWRSEFPILSEKTYLVSHSMGAMPRQAQDYLRQYTEEWAQFGITAWDEPWRNVILDHGNRVAGLIGAPDNTVTVHQNVSTLLSIVLSAIFQPNGSRKKVVTTDLNFPSLLYNLEMYQSLGLEVEIIHSPDGMTIPLALWEAAIDERTLAILVDHGIFRSGFVQDVGALTRLAHAKGAYAIIDVYQTVGCVPFDVFAWQSDFVLGGSHKWLCGGPGACWLYVRPDLIAELQPRVTGWFSHARPFDFSLEMDFADNALRFATATPAVPAMYAARAGLEIILEVGVEAIRARSLEMTRKIIDFAWEEGFALNTPLADEQRGGLICIDFPEARAVHDELIRQNFLIDYRPKCGIRVSPHFYTGEDEIIRFFEALTHLRQRFTG